MKELDQSLALLADKLGSGKEIDNCTHQLVGDVRGNGVSGLSFLNALAALMREHGITKVDVAWDVIPAPTPPK